MSCTSGSYNININFGTYPQTSKSGPFLICQRHMYNSSSKTAIAYNLMMDGSQSMFNYRSNTPSSGTTCASGTLSLGNLQFTPSNRKITQPVYAKMWILKDVVKGSYTDSLTVSVTF